MSMITFDADKSSVHEARLLVAALNEWLADTTEPDPATAKSRVQFCWRPDGSLDSLLTIPAVDAEE